MYLRIGSQPHGMMQLLSHVSDPNPVTRGVVRSILAKLKGPLFANGWHPGDARTVMSQYRRHILGCKRMWGSHIPAGSKNRTARGLVHYRAFIETYRAAKREVLMYTDGLPQGREV